MQSYWPEAPIPERRERLFQEWRRIVELLGAEIIGVRSALPLPPHNASILKLKAFEDMLDAVVCAWVAICATERRAKPYGDEDSAIWIPFLPVR